MIKNTNEFVCLEIPKFSVGEISVGPGMGEVSCEFITKKVLVWIPIEDFEKACTKYKEATSAEAELQIMIDLRNKWETDE